MSLGYMHSEWLFKEAHRTVTCLIICGHSVPSQEKELPEADHIKVTDLIIMVGSEHL